MFDEVMKRLIDFLDLCLSTKLLPYFFVADMQTVHSCFTLLAACVLLDGDASVHW